MPITIDEAATFFHYVKPNAIWPGDGSIWDANNHILNSFLSRFFYLIFGPVEWALRFHAVLLSGIYFLYTFKFAQLLKNTSLRWGFITAFLFPHFLLEFFAYTRGYGISMALLVAGLYHTITFLRDAKPLHLFAALVFSMLAVLANLTLFILLMMIIALSIAKCIHQFITEKKGLISLGVILMMVIVPMRWFVWFGLQLKERGRLYYGGQDGFWDVTVGTLLKYFLWQNIVVEIGVVVLFITIIVLLVVQLRKLKLELIFKPGNIWAILLIGSITANVLMNKLLGTNYLEDRTGMFYYPLFILSLCFLIDETGVAFKKPLAITLVALLMIMPIHFITHVNFTHSDLWPDDASMKPLFAKFKADAQKEGLQSPTVSGYHLRGLVFSYYNYVDGGQFNQIANITNTAGEVDYQIVSEEQCNQCEMFEPIAHEPISGHLLMKRKHFLKRENIFSQGGITTDGIVSGEFFEFPRPILDTLGGQIIAMEYKLTIDAHGNNFPAWLIVQVLDEKENVLNENMVGMSWLKPLYTGELNNFHYSVLLSTIPADAHSVKSFVWNLGKDPFEITQGEIRLNKLLNP